MLSLVQSRYLSEAFVKEACHFLCVDPDTLRVIFIPYVKSVFGLLQMAEVLADDTIVVGENLQVGCTIINLY